MWRHIRDPRHVRVDNDSNEDPEDDEELYVFYQKMRQTRRICCEEATKKGRH